MPNSGSGPKPGRESGKGKSGAYVFREIFQSRAYNSLTKYSPILLTHIIGAQRFSKRNGKGPSVVTNPNELMLSYSYAKKMWGITQPRMTRAFDELLAKGFIALTHQGGGYDGDGSKYKLVERYKEWEPGKVFEVRPTDVHRGFQGGKKQKQHT